MKTLYLLILVFTLFACSKKTPEVNDSIVIEGFIIEEATNKPFNPFAEAVVNLYDNTSFQTQGLVPIASVKVDQNGYYKLQTKHTLNESGHVELIAKEGEKYGGTGSSQNIQFKNNMQINFNINCQFSLLRTFVNQSNTNSDSVSIQISNSNGSTTQYYRLQHPRTLLFFWYLKGEEPNYVHTKIYNGTTYFEKQDTIRSHCLKSVMDSLLF